MLQLATPPERHRPALLASIGIHALAASAFGFVPLLAFPIAPGWQGEVWFVTQPVLAIPQDVKPVVLREPETPRSVSAGNGGLPRPAAAGAHAERAAATVQPDAIPEDLPPSPAFEPAYDIGVVGVPDGFDEWRGTPPGEGPPGGPGVGPIDVRGGGHRPDIVLPVPLDTPSPRYPDPARILRMEGAVVLSATIDATGRVVDVEIEKGVGPFLDRAALEAVSSWRYVPARIGARPVAVILRVTLTFRLL